MLQLYDKNKNKIKGLTKYKDYCIESVLKTGDKTLSFLYPSKFIDGIVEEGYIRNKTDEFVIKEIVARGEWTSIKVQMNVEDLEGKAWEHFNTTEQTIENCLNLACAGTGWTVQVNNVSKKRTVKKTNCSSWEIIQEAKKIYRVEIEFDTLNKVVKVYEKLGHDKGVYFSDEINLKALDIESNSYDFYTKIIAIGKENIKIEVENFQYSNKVKTLIWKDERYTVLENLREDATAKLQELSKPRKSYSADVIDLAKLNSKYKNILDYKLGDTITLISKDKKIREKQRIVKIVEYPDEPERNSCEIANTTLDFIDIQKEFQDTADTVNNITEDNGTISEEAIKVAVKNLTIDKADINSLNAAVARIGTLEATKANITELNAVNAKITNLQANKAEITDLIAGNIKFDVATGGTLDLQTLLSKFVTGENGQFLNLTTDNVTISNALIKDVIAKSISAEDLKASTISTNKFRITSDNGGIEIVGATQQFKDKNNKVRIQMGQDTQGNFNFILRGEDGTTTLIDHTGIKEKAIADDLIKEKMIAENAVGEKQINYSSLVTGLNKDANTSLIQASKVAIDLTGQKLDVAFNSLKSTVNDTKSKTESNTTSIGVINGQIDTLIKDTIIEENGTTVKLKDSYSTLKQTVNGINATVASHTSSITNLGTNLTNAQNTANSANSLADSKAKVFTSTPTTPYKIGDIWTGGPSGEIMKCKVARASGAYVASDWEKASKYTDDAKANAVEGNLNTLSGKVTTVESNYASLSQNLEGFKTNVASTYSTKIELSSVDGKVTALTSRVSTAESSITQLNNSIDLSVSSLKKIVQEGNNNLVANSNWFKGPSGWRLSTNLAGNYFYGVSGSMALEDKHYIRLGHSNNNPTSSIYADSSKFPVSPGEKITYGAFGAATSNVRFRIYLLFTSNIDDINIDNSFMPGYTSILYEGNASYTKKNLTVIVPDGAIRAFIRVRIDKIDTSINTDSSGVFSSLMVRKGEEVFEWCPSQGDSYTYIDEQTAKLQVNINDITSRVSSTESTISTINGNVSSLQTRMSSAEQKITTNSIIQTVQSTINNAMNSAINSANSSTDSKLQNYATKASMELTSTQLRLEFKSSGGGNLLKNGRPIRGKRGLANWNCSNSAGSTAVINLGDGGENLNGEVFGSGIWWNGTRESAGGNTWCCLFNNSLESYKFNKGKTYYVSLIIYSSTSGKNININIVDNNGLNHVGGYNITLNAGYQLVQFNFSPAQAGNKPNLGLYLNTPGSYNFYIPWAVVGEGYPVNNWIPNDNEIEDGNTTIDATGVKIYNGALTVLNNNGQVMLQGDSNGNLSFSGRLQPYDYQIRLFGNDCRIDGSAGAIRMQWNPQNYISVENGATRIYDNNSAGGTRYISFATDTEGHANIWGIQTRMKLLGNSSARPVIQSRNISDNAYGDFHGADFLNRSTIKDKTNVQEINDIDFKKLLMENTIKKYNLKTDVETVLDGFGLENTIDEVVASSADIRLGFILEELTQDARAMLSPGNMESISIYSMCSILWKVCQEQQKRIEILESKII
ncbi:phage tail protein [Clostridium tertium]|uniref:phage tail protein n=1 Tax=Clostridium tertium TaxID=1559 RepID=UPI003565F2D5